jgi:hypothetical protein
MVRTDALSGMTVADYCTASPECSTELLIGQPFVSKTGALLRLHIRQARGSQPITPGINIPPYIMLARPLLSSVSRRHISALI